MQHMLYTVVTPGLFIRRQIPGALYYHYSAMIPFIAGANGAQVIIRQRKALTAVPYLSLIHI